MKNPHFFDDEKPKPPRDDDEEPEKKSWRERDAQRDRSRHLSQSPKPTEKKTFNVKRDESVAKAALEGLFSGKKSKEQEAAWKNVFVGPFKTFSLRASNYVEKHGLPRDWDDLIRLLDHKEPAFVATILDRMIDMAPQETAIRRDLLNGKLRILKMEREEPELVEKFEKVEQTLAGLGS
ncbi:MAG: hypothetical protein V1798_01180 [Pseudomonadota bacterium]